MEVGILIGAALGILIGVILLYYAYLSFYKKKIMENTPTSKIRSLAMGLVEIYGEIVANKKKVLQAPFSQKNCVYYQYVIQVYSVNGKGRGSWNTIQSGIESIPFFLRDATGSVLVDAQAAEVNIEESFVFQSGGKKAVPKYIDVFLQKKNISSQGVFGNKLMRY